MKRRVGLLVMAYGTPRCEADILPYYTNIRRGYPPTEDEVRTLKARYAAIGGLSPLAKLTECQAQELVKQLNGVSLHEVATHKTMADVASGEALFDEANSDVVYELFIGHKHIAPTIEDAVSEMADAGITEAVAIVMAPYFSLFATAAYFERAERRARRYGMTIHQVQAWNEEPEFIEYWAKALQGAVANVNLADTAIIFTAHSLPYHVIHMGDTYPQMVEATAQRIAERAGVGEYHMAWQSAGVRGDWLTPNVETVTEEVASKVTSIIYVPIGFVCDHLEILYDNDIVCRTLCEDLGVQYIRVAMPNGDPLFVKAMTQAVRRLARNNEVK